MKARLILLLNINDIYFYYSLLIKTNAAAPSLGSTTPLPSLIHSAPVRYIVYVIWSGFNIIYYLLFLSPYYYTVSPSEVGTPMPLSPGQRIVPMTCDIYPWGAPRCEQGTITLPLQRHIVLLFCQVYFSLSPPLLSVEANCQLPPVLWRGSWVFCLCEGPTFFAEILSILCWVFCWLSLTLSLHCTPRTLTRIKL